jgi:muramoyltetrapeptide carboxypeptidase
MIGIVAPSSCVPPIELKLGVQLLKESGLSAKVHPQCLLQHQYLAGTDDQRAKALFEYAIDPLLPVVWAARGGYGAMRILPILDQLGDQLSKTKKVPKNKLFVGYSDSTALFEYVQNKWGWSVLHAPMPGLRSFLRFEHDEWKSLVAFAAGNPLAEPWGDLRLKHVGGPRVKRPISAELTGGNLTVWASLAGSPYFSKAKNRILFFEDVSEFPYRIDRMISQLDHAGGFESAKAIILGDFLDCKDSVPQALKKMPKLGLNDVMLKSPQPKDMEPLRKTLDEKKAIFDLFSEIGDKHSIPVYAGFPGGHGPGHASLPIGAKYELSGTGKLALQSWNWAK